MLWSPAVSFGARAPAVRMHTMTVVGSKLFVLGGSTLKDEFHELSVFDTETMFWDSPATFGTHPEPFRTHTATLVGDKIYVIGGGDGPRYYDSVYVLDIPTMTWSKPTVQGTVPEARRAHTALAVGKLIYIFGGGTAAGVKNDLHLFDTETNTFTKKECSGELPQARGYHSMCMLPSGTELLVHGGTDTRIVFSDVCVLDTTTLTWSKRKVHTPRTINNGTAPARLAHTLVQVGPAVFSTCGLDGATFVNEALCLDLSDMAWKRPPVLPCVPPSARGYHTSVMIDDRLFLFGGTDNKACFDDMMTLDLGTWSFLPISKTTV